jgi:hypothetical protein
MKMSLCVCCDIIRLIWTWQQQNFNLMCFALNKTCISHHLLALFLFHRQYQPKKPHMVCGCLIFARISVQMHRYPLEDIFIYSCWLQIVQYTPTYLFSYILQLECCEVIVWDKRGVGLKCKHFKEFRYLI